MTTLRRRRDGQRDVSVLGLLCSMILTATVVAEENVMSETSLSPSPATVIRDNNTVVIQGVEPLSWGKSGETTYAGALALALSVTERPVSYDEIMGVSGLAFRVRWWHWTTEPAWCPSTPVGEFPEHRADTATGAGWRFNDISRMDREADPHMEEFAAEIKSAIDAGRPVVCYPTTSNLNCGVIYGYEDDGAVWLIRDYFKFGSDEPLKVEAAKLGPWVFIPDSVDEPVPAKDALRQAFRIGVKNWNRVQGPNPETVPYWHGDTAYEKWIGDLRTAESLTDEKRGSLFFANWWCYEILEDARRSAVRYLRERAKDAEGAEREAAERAAGYYEEASKVLSTPVESGDAFMGPWTGKKVADWTSEVREREIAILSEVRRLEALAIGEMASALDVMEPGIGKRLDLSDVKLAGAWFVDDSFATAFAEAARLLGSDVDIATVAAVSGNAFAPRINLREDCSAWWHAEGRDEGIERVARRLGLGARLLDKPHGDGDTALLKARASAIRDAMDRGEVVIGSGWQVDMSAFTPWSWFGVVTDVLDDGTILGAGWNGKRDNRAGHWGNWWAISASESAIPPHDSDVATLETAISAIRGSREPYQPSGDVVFGLAAMDAWIAKMEQTPFCEPCHKSAPDRVWTCAKDNAQTTTGAARAVASFLRARCASFREGARPHIEEAARQYDRIVTSLRPAITGEGGESYQQFIGDADAQRRHAETLREVRTAYERAAGAMEKTLVAERVVSGF